MTDDLNLPDRLRTRAASVRSTPDLADVERRSTDRRRRRTRVAGSALALVAVLGTLGGFALGRSSQEEPPTFVATGQGLGAASGDDAAQDDEVDLIEQLAGNDVLDALALSSTRTTAEGITLDTRLGDVDGAPSCGFDRIARIGVKADRVTGVAMRSLRSLDYDSAGAAAVVGLADSRPVWVAMVRTTAPHVTTTFPNGTVDEADAVDGVAVTAAYADTRPAAAYLADSITVSDSSSPDRVVVVEPDVACLDSPDTPTTSVPVDGSQKPPLPEPGEQPTDLEETRADVITMWETAGDPSLSKQERARYQEDPDVWLDATLRFEEEHPDYAEIATTVHSEVDEVVFTAPDRAAVRYQLVSEDAIVPRYQLGTAVLAADGTWRVATETSCRLIELSGTKCRPR